jgi:glycine/D-amino acid oxidase-like deaminating enzyme
MTVQSVSTVTVNPVGTVDEAASASTAAPGNDKEVIFVGQSGNYTVLEGTTVIRGISSNKGEGRDSLDTIAIVKNDENAKKLRKLDANGATVLSDARVIIDSEARAAMAALADSDKLTLKGNKNENLIELPPRQHERVEYPLMKLSTTDTPLEPPKKGAKHVLILGAGVSGLMVAWMLLDKGYRVTIFADDWAWTRDFKRSRMTSQIAGALWEFPPGGCGLTEIEAAGNGWATVEHYQEWALQSYEFYHKYDTEISNPHERDGSSLGLRFADLHQFFYGTLTGLSTEGNDEAPEEGDDEDLGEEEKKLKAIKIAHAKNRMPGSRLKKYGDLSTSAEFKTEDIVDLKKTGLKSGYTHRAPILNTDKAMGYLMALVKAKGANLETRTFKYESETGSILDDGNQLLEDHDGDAIVNATGLGAGKLMNDKDVYPVRGAVLRVDNTRKGHFRHLNDAYLVPAQKDANDFPTKTIFIVPRSDDVLYVGSIIQPNNYDKSLTPESPEVETMWERAGDFIPRLRHAGLVPEYSFAQGLRPFSKKNAKVRAEETDRFRLVHNYGHGGSGWTLGIGTARCAVLLLEKMLAVDKKFKETAKSANKNLYG